MTEQQWKDTLESHLQKALELAKQGVLMTQAKTIGAEPAMIANDIYQFINEKYPNVKPYQQGYALWLAMQLTIGADVAADVMRQVSILPAK